MINEVTDQSSSGHFIRGFIEVNKVYYSEMVYVAKTIRSMLSGLIVDWINDRIYGVE